MFKGKKNVCRKFSFIFICTVHFSTDIQQYSSEARRMINVRGSCPKISL
jgi:hypothetical protein